MKKIIIQKQVVHMLLYMMLAVLAITPLAIAQDTSIDQTIENTRVALEKYVETQRIISKEKHDHALAQEILQERIYLVQREIQTLHGKIIDAENSIAEADKKREEMIEENEKLKDATSVLGDILVNLEKRTIELVNRLPDPIYQNIKPLSQRLPNDSTKTELPITERFQNVVGILNLVDKFNREITVTSENRNLEDGSVVQVAALYIGLGQGYYANTEGTIAGTAIVADRGWTWKAVNEVAKQIVDVIAILKNEKVASYVQVPVNIH